MTRSKGLACLAVATSLGLWNQVSPKVVVQDTRLGKLELTCPARTAGGQKQLWLTFDDGPGPDTLKIVKMLNAFNFSATFFFIGEQVEAYSNTEELRSLIRAGHHSVANHSFSHPNFLSLAPNEIKSEMVRNQRLLSQSFPETCVPLFRPPFGYRNSATLSFAEDLDLSVIGWSLNSLDFLSGNAERVCERIEKQVEPGTILLFHDGRKGRERTVRALSRTLSWLTDNDYEGFSPR